VKKDAISLIVQSGGTMAEAESLKNPGLPGEIQFETVIYGSPPLTYPATLNQFVIYNTPDPAYVTGRINVSAFANLGFAPWPFANTNAPLNGHVCIPRGRGPFPLAVFAHGNHTPAQNSTPGYIYLCELLASHGIIAATIDVNFLNGGFGENDARAIVHLEHLKQFRTWNNTATHPLHGKVDLNRILIVGHSRGGEGVGHASYFNRLASIGAVNLDGLAPFFLGPYRFGLSAVAAIAPTDRQFIPVSGPTVVPDPYYIIHGSKDGDVFDFQGYHTYERAHAVDLANPTVSSGKFKAMLWVHKANHNQFNSTWASETGAGVAMTRASQEQVAKVHLGALAQAVLLDRAAYFDVLRDHGAAVIWDPPGTDFVSQYLDPERILVQHNQEGVAAPVVSLPVQGTVAADAVVATRALTLLTGGVTTTITLRLVWNALGSRLLLTVDPATLPVERYKVLALRVGQSTDPNNAANRDQDFTLQVSSGSRTASVAASALHRLLYPDAPVAGPAKIMMQTLRLPVAQLVADGVEPRDIRSIAFFFDRRATGTLYVGDLQFSN
jgi:hypothetical protein